ncbi:TetR/AcrR family transcriptional regulator [Streptomyces sp. NPDC059837]|uniref:TetR/AcrR family transcriptional regulator n=1 Tax=unclassified Streptomyces TaxID=2593676 RepID=UPI00225598E9|nr:TetR/AcrR family transcriptional regulator [Streptomyces sp. NBC_00268]MCX5191187.1 TetR/AcrR family transcriptional regulator [Streptomyces sp. NBC_00268]
MGRASRAQAAEHRDQIVAAASRLFREQGSEVTLVELTGAVGLTTGGFYRQFKSKDALLGEATAHAFEDLRALLDGFEAAHHGDHSAARAAFIDYYLSPEHRDDAAHGCPASGLNATISRQPADSQARQRYVQGVQGLASWLGPTPSTADQHSPSNGGPDAETAQVSDDALGALCTMVGALVLARATNGSALSERILTSAHTSLVTEDD